MCDRAYDTQGQELSNFVVSNSFCCPSRVTHRPHSCVTTHVTYTQGQELTNFVVSNSFCCPSRVTLLTGKLVHNTNLTSNYYPYGGFGRFAERRLDGSWLPTW